MNDSTNLLSLEGLVFEAIEINIDGHILSITLNRPEKRNAINTVMGNEITYALSYASQESNVRVVIIQAKGDVFCAGGDLGGMLGKEQKSTSTVPKLGDTSDISLLIRNLCKPLICKIQGSVYAGALLMICNATHAIAADHVKFATPEIKRGIWPFMVMAGLFRVMPKRQGLDFIMRGEAIDALTAEKYGLITQAVAKDELDEIVNKLANDFANLPPNTMKMGLEAYNRQDDMAFDDALPYLQEQLKKCLGAEDAKEGIAAFFEKREPKWKSRKDD
ncbi:MAG: enoyl-CoA hydratase-related protein [Candidatus Poseidoniia archaeon]|nr:enoyl-CoA hydratase-related protein [Candidatus Poseidoniia archaeon]